MQQMLISLSRHRLISFNLEDENLMTQTKHIEITLY